ncbi:MAG: hypothetical protein IH831_05890 [Planctomycetes bacterium]|nr:hypothetical protein [Planctomycetota bacterium]
MKRDLRNLKLLCCLAAVASVGCDKVDPPAFRLNMVEAVSNETAPEYQQEISNVLGAMFGTPDEPYALPETGLDLGRLRLAAGRLHHEGMLKQAGYTFEVIRQTAQEQEGLA